MSEAKCRVRNSESTTALRAAIADGVWTVMVNSAQRIICRDGVNAVRTFLEHHGCVFQEVDLQNDFGKDGYVDIGKDGAVTFLCAALQIKSGRSYRTAKGEYFIPVENHADNWRHSTIPVFGLIYDPDDTLIRWVDITGYLRAHPREANGNIPVSRTAVLTESSLRGEFAAAIAEYVGRFGTIALNLLSDGHCRPMHFMMPGPSVDSTRSTF